MSHTGSTEFDGSVVMVDPADGKYGEVPAAFIELWPGTTLTEQEVIVHWRGGLASEWPMSSTKVQTFRLREQL
jgi:fatty-acyl-CoA synthase